MRIIPSHRFFGFVRLNLFNRFNWIIRIIRTIRFDLMDMIYTASVPCNTVIPSTGETTPVISESSRMNVMIHMARMVRLMNRIYIYIYMRYQCVWYIYIYIHKVEINQVHNIRYWLKIYMYMYIYIYLCIYVHHDYHVTKQRKEAQMCAECSGCAQSRIIQCCGLFQSSLLDSFGSPASGGWINKSIHKYIKHIRTITY